MNSIEVIYFTSVTFGILIPALFSLYIWKAYISDHIIYSKLEKVFAKLVKNAFKISLLSVVLSIIALSIFYHNRETAGIRVMSYLSIAVSISLGTLLIRNLLVSLYIKYPTIFEKKYNQNKIDNIMTRGIHAGYAVIVCMILLIIMELLKITGTV